MSARHALSPKASVAKRGAHQDKLDSWLYLQSSWACRVTGVINFGIKGKFLVREVDVSVLLGGPRFSEDEMLPCN